MAAEDITVTTVGLGGGVDESLLRMISDVGGGRFYKVLDPQSLPRIFTRETEMVSRSAAVEEYFQPQRRRAGGLPARHRHRAARRSCTATSRRR